MRRSHRPLVPAVGTGCCPPPLAPRAVTRVFLLQLSQKSVLPQCLATHPLCLQSCCVHLTAGKPGCRQGILPSPCRKRMKIERSIQQPHKHLKYFWFTLLVMIPAADSSFLTDCAVPVANLGLAGVCFSHTVGSLP